MIMTSWLEKIAEVKTNTSVETINPLFSIFVAINLGVMYVLM
jgi:hypothetical protein